MKANSPTPAGMFIMAGIPGPVLDSNTREMIQRHGLCNFIIFARNCSQGPSTLKELILNLQEECLINGLPPPIIAVDQEGGKVQRLGPPFWPPLSSNREAATSYHPVAAVKGQAATAAEALKNAGINLNLAPVLDLFHQEADKVLDERCYGNLPEEVAVLGATYIKEIQSLGIGATAKHFPGIGGVGRDPHVERPTISREDTALAASLIPFERAIQGGVAAIMTSHVVFTGYDPLKPATFSPFIARFLLRERLGFTGLLLTDDLEMGGAIAEMGAPEAAAAAFAAGHDLLLVCQDQTVAAEALERLQTELNHRQEMQKRAEESTLRLERFRRRFLSPLT